MLVYSILTWGEAEKIVEKLFDVFDVDGTGRVSKDEMKSVVRDLHVLLKHLYNSYSKYNLNLLFSSGKPTESDTVLFEQMDKNHDEFVDKSEFVSAILEYNSVYGQNLACLFAKLFEAGSKLDPEEVDIRECYEKY